MVYNNENSDEDLPNGAPASNKNPKDTHTHTHTHTERERERERGERDIYIHNPIRPETHSNATLGRKHALNKT